MTAEPANAKAIIVIKPRHHAGRDIKMVSNEPVKVQNRQTKKFMPEKAVPNLNASCSGGNPIA